MNTQTTITKIEQLIARGNLKPGEFDYATLLIEDYLREGFRLYFTEGDREELIQACKYCEWAVEFTLTNCNDWMKDTKIHDASDRLIHILTDYAFEMKYFAEHFDRLVEQRKDIFIEKKYDAFYKQEGKLPGNSLSVTIKEDAEKEAQQEVKQRVDKFFDYAHKLSDRISARMYNLVIDWLETKGVYEEGHKSYSGPKPDYFPED